MIFSNRYFQNACRSVLRLITNPYFKSVCKYGLGLGLLAYVIWRNWSGSPGSNAPGLKDAFAKPVHFGPLFSAAAAYLMALLITFFRWYILVRAQDLPFRLFDALRLGLVGFFFNSFLPAGSVGGDIVKAAFLAREQSRRTVAVATVLIDRAIGLWSLVWLVFLSGGLFWLSGVRVIVESENIQRVILTAGAIAVATYAVWFLLGFLPQWRAQRFAGRLLKIPKIGGSAAEFWRAVWMYRCKGLYVAAGLGLAIIAHVFFVLTFYFAAATFGDAAETGQIPSLTEHFVLVPVGMAIEGFVPVPGGVGAGEYSFGKLYVLAGKAESAGVMAALARRIVIYAWAILGYLVYLRMKPSLAKVEPRAGSVSDGPEPGPSLTGPEPGPSLTLPARLPTDYDKLT
jgi:uncharacterized protein (TIRG00374 family)